MSTYQTFVAPISDTLAHFQAWAQSFGGAFTTFGWAAQTGHGEIVATGTGATYAWTSPVLPTTALVAQINYNFKGAFVPSTTYTGSNTVNAANVDVVTSGGITYAHITASSSLATAPASDTTNWQPLLFEIWKSAGSNTSSLPIFVKIVYTTQTTGGNNIRYHLSIGTGVDVNGNLVNGVALATAAPTTVVPIDPGAASSGTVGEMDFSGDSDNFRWIQWRGGPAAVYNGCCVIDRSKTSSGTDSNAFVFVGMILPIAGVTRSSSSVIMNPTSLGSQVAVVTLSGSGWPGIVSPSTLTSTVAFGGTPAYPLFPIVGFLANPALGVIGFVKGDVTDGQQLPVWIYGTSHNFLVMSANGVTASYTLNGLTNSVCPAILWE